MNFGVVYVLLIIVSMIIFAMKYKHYLKLISIVKLLLLWNCIIRASIREQFNGMRFVHVYHLVASYIPIWGNYSDSDIYEQIDSKVDDVHQVKNLVEYIIRKNIYSIDNKLILCIGDFGVGKSSLIINIYITLLCNQKCKIISLSKPECFDTIAAISDKSKTVLLLDALDENSHAYRDSIGYLERLCETIIPFYKVVITCKSDYIKRAMIRHALRRNNKLQLITKARYYIIEPFTSDTLKKHLHKRYKGFKYERACQLMDKTVQPFTQFLLMENLDKIIRDKLDFDTSLQLIDYILKCYINKYDIIGTYNELLIVAKAIYYHWLETGQIACEKLAADCITGMPEEDELQKYIKLGVISKSDEGLYSFTYRLHFEYLLALLTLSDYSFSDELCYNQFKYCKYILYELANNSTFPNIGRLVELIQMPQLGIANYCLKCWKPEESVKLLSEFLDNNKTLTKTEQVYVITHMARSLRYQRREDDARSKIIGIMRIIQDIEINDIDITVWSEFCWELANCVWIWGDDIGREFIENVIHNFEFYDINDAENWRMNCILKCYCSLCRCARDSYYRSEALRRMIKQYKEQYNHRRNDYAEYLLCQSFAYGMPYGGSSTRIDRTLLHRYEHVMDVYTTMQTNSWYAIDVMFDATTECSQDSWSEAQEVSLDYLVQIYDICDSIYPDEDYSQPECTYYFNLAMYVLMWQLAFKNYPEEKIIDQINLLYKCLHTQFSTKEAPVSYIELAKLARRIGYDSSIEDTSLLKDCIEIAQCIYEKYNLSPRSIGDHHIK